MTDMEQRAAAREFTAYWQNRGDEKQETQTFWLTLLQKVLGVEDADKLIAFEVPVKLGTVNKGMVQFRKFDDLVKMKAKR